MKAPRIALSLTLGFAAIATVAAPPTQNVNVVNTPLLITVENPSSEVTVNNDATNPVPVTVQNQTAGPAKYQFVGFTAATYDGGQGIVTYTNTCNGEFLGSRMCTYGEFYTTSPFPDLDANAIAWIWPWDNKTSSTAPNNRDCSVWISTLASESGAVIRGDGRATTAPCSSTLPIACCAPAP